MNKNYYITTTLPYVNASPHIGFALEIVQADTLARFKRLMGYDVCFNFGTDEHGLKIFRRAQEENKDPQKYTDEYAKKFDKLKQALNLSYDRFIRTTDPYHVKAAQEFWKLCAKNGDIYKKNYRIKYCVGCELEKTGSELINGRCPIHPNQNLETIEEENYFFRFSKYQDTLLNFYKNHTDFVIPGEKYHEIINFVKNGLEDFSISRLKEKMPWGIDVPGDPKHVMYVWFDALINYISTLGWPDNLKDYRKWWPGVQVAGKDNLRQQTAIWQAMLMSAGLPNSLQVFIHGFITSEGKKISKSTGNTVDPFALVKKYGTDALRYYLLREIPSYSDGDFSERRFREIYNSELANNLGNLASRIARICDQSNITAKTVNLNFPKVIAGYPDLIRFLDNYQFDEYIRFVQNNIVTRWNQSIDNHKPWQYKTDIEKHLPGYLDSLVNAVREIAVLLLPVIPDTALKILEQYRNPKISSIKPLFPRLA